MIALSIASSINKESRKCLKNQSDAYLPLRLDCLSNDYYFKSL